MAKLNIDAQAAIQQLRDVINEVENLKKSSKNMSQATADNFAKLESSVAGLRRTISDLGNKLNYLEAILKKNAAAANANSSATNANASANNANASAANANANATNKNATATNKNTEETKKGTKANKVFNASLGNMFRLLGVISAVQFLKDLISNVYETTKQFDSFAFALERISGSMENFKDSERFLTSITEDFGVELVATTNRWIKFLAAAKESGLALKDTEDIFRSMTKAAGVLGLQTDELQGVYLALEQMLSKGKVTTEELRRQLGERLPGAMGIMAAAVGVTIPKLDEMLKKGEVLSAEVLPKFAKALEIAYDIENVTRIETITAEQNRLTAAWQRFIKNVTEGESALKGVFGWFLSTLRETVSWWDKFFQSDDQRLEERIVNKTKSLVRSLEDSYSKQLGLQKGFVNEQDRLENAVRRNKTRLDRALNAEERALEEEKYNQSIQALQNFNDERDALIKQHAVENIEQARNEYDEDLKLKEKLVDAKMKLDVMASKNYNKFFRNQAAYFKEVFGDDEIFGKAITNLDEFEEALKQANTNIVVSTSKWYLFKKLIEDSNVVVPPDEESTKKTQRNLRRLRDYYLEIMNEILKKSVMANDETANNEKANLEDRLNAMRASADARIAIEQNQYAISERDAKARMESEITSINQSIANGTLAREKGVQRIKDLEDEKNEYLRLQALKLSNDLIGIETALGKRMESLVEETTDNMALTKTQNIYDKEIIVIKKTFEASAKTAEDRKKMEKDLADVAVRATNAIIDKKIELLKADILLAKGMSFATDEYIANLQRQIDALEASRPTAPLTDDVDEWKSFFNEIINLAKEFNDAFGDLVDASFQRRIEFINAEIAAEERKYDKMIELAENDVEQKKTLERNKEEAIQALERKRLKEEQKQAKARKAFAVADIAISTAQGIMKVWATYANPVIAGALTAALVALAGVQTAAVMVQPIPQYKDGLVNAKGDHVGMINDGGYQEYIERNNKILTTSKKDAIIPIKKGDTIYKNYDDMASRSSLFKIKNNNTINSFKAEQLKDVIESSIGRGFKNAKINNKNNINVVNRSNNDAYRNKVNRWTN